jgi:hypothetical protein
LVVLLLLVLLLVLSCLKEERGSRRCERERGGGGDLAIAKLARMVRVSPASGGGAREESFIHNKPRTTFSSDALCHHHHVPGGSNSHLFQRSAELGWRFQVVVARCVERTTILILHIPACVVEMRDRDIAIGLLAVRCGRWIEGDGDGQRDNIHVNLFHVDEDGAGQYLSRYAVPHRHVDEERW